MIHDVNRNDADRDGWLARSRNTNYLGEVMLYSAYAVLAQHWLPWTVDIGVWLLLFVTNMVAKEESLRKKVSIDVVKLLNVIIETTLGRSQRVHGEILAVLSKYVFMAFGFFWHDQGRKKIQDKNWQVAIGETY